MAPHIPDTIDEKLLGLYLSDHLTGATAGLGRIERMAKDFTDTPVHAELATLAAAIGRERELLRKLIHELGIRQRPHRQAAAWLAEHAGRLKLNGRLLSRSPMTLVLESELMRAAILAKIGGWQTLEELAPDLGLEPSRFAGLSTEGQAQIETLGRVHDHARRNAFRRGRSITG
ncbi:hypothetical protein [Arthrobacter sp. C9C5]|uniref:hypothetical protein n=1 Tax=Arthrobacter sp. C9C5 TaxID=2735267 RepID=UPI00158489B3|nr:hypothetical protein [Arthrobacter sp. C9C5]NUU32315.1 hypothetical protein [Arthrobacter sp. C9C5]